MSTRKQSLIQSIDHLAASRADWLRRNAYYYKDLIAFLKYTVPEQSTILEVGCGTGDLLNALHPRVGVGIDISGQMIASARQKYSHLHFKQMDVAALALEQKFDYIIVSDSMVYFDDVQVALHQLRTVCHASTRLIITHHNSLWQPLLNLAEKLKLKMPSPKLNWLTLADVSNLLFLEDYDVVKTGRRLLFPKYLPLISTFLNRYLSHFPVINTLCLVQYIIARPLHVQSLAPLAKSTVSVIIPARNEKGNIEAAVKRTPQLGAGTEIIFIEGGSSDGTLAEIQRVCKQYAGQINITYAVQDGQGKGDAVRKGYAMAKGDILMILDADLTVPPEDLTKFYQAMADGKGEFINGTRLVYPMEDEAMRILNMIANKCFSLAFSWLLDQRIKDTLCGTKVLTKVQYNRLAANRHFFGEFDPFGDFDLLFGAAKLNLKIIEVPIRYAARTYGSTNIARFTHGWLLMKMFWFAVKKIKFI